MKTTLRALMAPILAALLMAAGSASAGVLTSKLSVDNGYVMYLSTSDNVQGTAIDSGNNWTTTYVDSNTLVAGTSYFLHIFAYDEGGVAGLLGDFSIAGGSHTFANGLASMTTNTINWMGNNTGFNGSYGAVGSPGTDGIGPWGNRPNIADSASWIWVGDSWNQNAAYFTTKITAVRAVPEPASLALFGLALAGLAAARRRKSAK